MMLARQPEPGSVSKGTLRVQDARWGDLSYGTTRLSGICTSTWSSRGNRRRWRRSPWGKGAPP